MRYLVEQQFPEDDGIWKPLNVLIEEKYATEIADNLTLFDETNVAKYYIEWTMRRIVKVTAIDLADAL